MILVTKEKARRLATDGYHCPRVDTPEGRWYVLVERGEHYTQAMVQAFVQREIKRRKGMAIVSEEEYYIGKGAGNYVALAATPDTGQLPETTYVRMTTKGEFNLSDVLQFAIDYWAEEGIKPEQIEKKDILEERQETHGEFKDVAPISQTLKIYFRAQSTWDALTFVQQEALDNIAQKIARIFAGNHNFADHWVDIQGYAKLAQQEIEKNGDRPSSLK